MRRTVATRHRTRKCRIPQPGGILVCAGGECFCYLTGTLCSSGHDRRRRATSGRTPGKWCHRRGAGLRGGPPTDRGPHAGGRARSLHHPPRRSTRGRPPWTRRAGPGLASGVVRGARLPGAGGAVTRRHGQWRVHSRERDLFDLPGPRDVHGPPAGASAPRVTLLRPSPRRGDAPGPPEPAGALAELVPPRRHEESRDAARALFGSLPSAGPCALETVITAAGTRFLFRSGSAQALTAAAAHVRAAGRSGS